MFTLLVWLINAQCIVFLPVCQGNWLRDYSQVGTTISFYWLFARDKPMLCHQAMDIAGLSKLSADTITLIVGILGFLVSLSYSTNT